jgi:hypothetical protein
MSTTVTLPPSPARVAEVPPALADGQALLPAPPDPVTLSVPTTDDIAACAYGLFEARGCAHGHDVEDWLEAERLLLAERTAPLNETGTPLTES